MPVLAVVLAFFIMPANAQTNDAQKYAAGVASACVGNWQSQPCLKASSEAAMALTAKYMASLNQTGKTTQAETIKQHCAAATAAMTEQVPADAMRSAYTECANMIYDVSEQTGIKPDQSLYQLLVAPVLCLSGDQRCSMIEQGLASYR